ncbi:fucosylgalactoside 3-alpha-galactosyltransferase [Acanthamoeba castellanii str. Neff]|uniref:Fucosylgalactoside 3-alpha-galactosyltransferase n=1 Tax=Acanthamoeba castellanii (strain ATCC 30010 / Neff) TaxID=1257118 RepID=L8HJC5_ACACF|nr:fucosylgalactoside 3-alpha-galactosyltransferase [Acanthamoeba castellanii str. Neff]ELR24793.1 fucosylgalactoside 3-alpha-galactosyltransferase [Acanthamoeba castellanii str. Neff]
MYEAKRVAKDGVVVLALCNAGYLDLLLNWKASVDRLNITNYVIVPNDIKAAQQLSFLGIDWAYDPAIGLGDLASSEAARYTTDKKDPMHQSWNQVVHKKAANVRAIIATGLNVLVTDVDIVFMKDPLPLFVNKTVDLFFINDDMRKGGQQALCGGFWLGRSNEHTMAFIDSVQRCEQKGIKEQPCFNKWHDKIRRQRNEVMPMDDFPSGYYYFHEFWKTTSDGVRVKVRPDPYIVHNNWIVGHENKIARFLQHGLLMVRTSELAEKMANFSFNPNITTHDQLVAFHLQQRVGDVDRVHDVLSAILAGNADHVVVPQASPTVPNAYLAVLVWSCPATLCLVLLVWVRQRRRLCHPTIVAT